MIHQRVRILADAGKDVETFATGDGTRLLLLPYGARTLGLYAPGSDESFYWFNPCLEQVDTARALFAGSGWHNTGGDRTWLAPELDVFFPDAKAERYVQPRELDMSDYAVERVGGGIQMSRKMMLHLARPDHDTPWVSPGPPVPMAMPPGADAPGQFERRRCGGGWYFCLRGRHDEPSVSRGRDGGRRPGRGGHGGPQCEPRLLLCGIGGRFR